ncbi:MAG: phosphatidate cytidylyltransferase [Microbacteriaceae bacterium]
MDIDHAIRDAGAKMEARTGRNLVAAIGIGVGLGALFIASLAFDKQWFIPFIGVFVGFGTWELATISRTAQRHVPRIPILIAALAMLPATFYVGYIGQIVTLGAGILFAIVWHLVQRRLSSSDITDRDMLMSAFTLAYVPFLASFAVLMTARPDGQWWTMGTMIIIASVDTGAFATGVMFGKTPLAPKISPKKTWEGFIGSAIFGSVAGYFIAVYMVHIDWWWGVLLGLIILGVATVGDLIESLIKRELGTKDASHFLPGHGGFLDRLDSVLPSMFVASVFAILFS